MILLTGTTNCPSSSACRPGDEFEEMSPLARTERCLALAGFLRYQQRDCMQGVFGQRIPQKSLVILKHVIHQQQCFDGFVFVHHTFDQHFGVACFESEGKGVDNLRAVDVIFWQYSGKLGVACAPC